jgi:hypothetical protein
MSAYDLSYPDPTRDMMIGKPDRCFLCGAAVNGIVVYWSGMAGRVVFLHPACAKSLGCHLISDSVRAKQMNSQKFKPVLLQRDTAA